MAEVGFGGWGREMGDMSSLKNKKDYFIRQTYLAEQDYSSNKPKMQFIDILNINSHWININICRAKTDIETIPGKTGFIYLCTCRSAKSGSNFFMTKPSFLQHPQNWAEPNYTERVWLPHMLTENFFLSYGMFFKNLHRNRSKNPRSRRPWRQ